MVTHRRRDCKWVQPLPKTVWQHLLQLDRDIPVTQQFHSCVYAQQKHGYVLTKTTYAKMITVALFLIAPNRKESKSLPKKDG